MIIQEKWIGFDIGPDKNPNDLVVRWTSKSVWADGHTKVQDFEINCLGSIGFNIHMPRGNYASGALGMTWPELNDLHEVLGMYIERASMMALSCTPKEGVNGRG